MKDVHNIDGDGDGAYLEDRSTFPAADFRLPAGDLRPALDFFVGDFRASFCSGMGAVSQQKQHVVSAFASLALSIPTLTCSVLRMICSTGGLMASSTSQFNTCSCFCVASRSWGVRGGGGDGRGGEG